MTLAQALDRYPAIPWGTPIPVRLTVMPEEGEEAVLGDVAFCCRLCYAIQALESDRPVGRQALYPDAAAVARHLAVAHS